MSKLIEQRTDVTSGQIEAGLARGRLERSRAFHALLAHTVATVRSALTWRQQVTSRDHRLQATH
jgi:hypothetical protein